MASKDGASDQDPVKQFAINELIKIESGGLNLSLTDQAFYMFVIVALSTGFLAMATARSELVPRRLQSIGEVAYDFVAGMIRSTAGEAGMKFFPFVFTIFIFIFTANMLGMLPMAKTVTAQIVVNATLALIVIGVVLLYGIYKNGLGFFKVFAPSGIPWPLYILVTPIEIISFLSRPLSLTVRLFANMLAGHITLKVFAGFVASLLASGGFAIALAPFAFAMTLGVTALEILVAFLQAYVFAILTSIYLNDALHPGH